MKHKKSIQLLLPVLIVFHFSLATLSCHNKNNTTKIEQVPNDNAENEVFAGNYVDEGYANKNEGSDWVAIIVSVVSDSSWHVSFRSRVDKKKPTCRFDTDVFKKDKNTLTTNIEGKNILFQFADSSVSVITEKKEELDVLRYYCSGGGSLAGSYRKINVPLDSSQMDNRIFSTMVNLQNISFDIWSTREKDVDYLHIQPIGLKIDNSLITLSIPNQTLLAAEIEDLNADGFPEVFVYSQSTGKEKIGHVIGYSVNNGKSVSQISFPEKNPQSKAFIGYRGGDEWRVIENRLAQRFRLYKPEDINQHPTGKYRQISYQMVNGENSRKMVIDKIIEFNAN
jgi:hypothetical protein